MFFFKKPPPPMVEKTQVMPMLRSLLSNKVKCTTCNNRVDIEGAEPLSNIPCDACGASVFVPKSFRGYWLYRHIATGRHSVLYRAISEEFPDEKFAMKLLLPRYKKDETYIERLCANAQMIVNFHEHPSVVSATEYGYSNTEEDYFLAMEFIEGEILQSRVDRKGALEEPQALALASELLGLQKFVLRNGYIVRGIQPNNIMLRRDTPVVLKFESCCSLKDAQANLEPVEIEDFPHHIPPERMLGHGESFASEVYSLGTTLFYLLTGTTLFDGDDLQSVAEQYAFQPRDEIVQSALEGRSEVLIEMVRKMVDVEPNARFQSVDRVENELRKCGA